MLVISVYAACGFHRGQIIRCPAPVPRVPRVPGRRKRRRRRSRGARSSRKLSVLGGMGKRKTNEHLMGKPMIKYDKIWRF